MNILDLLRGGQGGNPLAPQPNFQGQLIHDGTESGNGGPDIQVAAPPQRTIEEDTRAEPGPRKTDELIQRKGMFGVKGTLRDVLGLIGDSLVMGQGGKAIYRPVREQEKIGSAIYGYNQDPTGAIDRAAIVSPDTAMDLQKQYDTGRRIDQQIAAQRIAGEQKARSTLGSYASTVNSAEKYALARPQLQKYADANNLDIKFPEQYDPEFMGDTLQRGMDPNEIVDNRRADAGAQSQNDYRDGQLGISRQRAGEQAKHNRAMEARPTAQRTPPRATASNVDAEVLAAVQRGDATPAQQRYYDGRLAKGTSGGKQSVLDRLRSGGGSKGPPPPPNGGSLRKVK